MMERAREAARQTPDVRNRAADFYRTAAIGLVVLGHWVLVAPYAPAGALELRNVLAEQPWTQYLTWVFQVMPVFFFVGGYSNAASWASVCDTPERRALWATRRLRRLLVPVVPLVVLWAVAAAVARQLGTSQGLVRDASQAALIPVWFLAVYIMVSLVVPVSHALWERLGLWSVAILAALAVAVDLIGVGLGEGWLRGAEHAGAERHRLDRSARFRLASSAGDPGRGGAGDLAPARGPSAGGPQNIMQSAPGGSGSAPSGRVGV